LESQGLELDDTDLNLIKGGDEEGSIEIRKRASELSLSIVGGGHSKATLPIWNAYHSTHSQDSMENKINALDYQNIKMCDTKS
jgi:hypothetical protein